VPCYQEIKGGTEGGREGGREGGSGVKMHGHVYTHCLSSRTKTNAEDIHIGGTVLKKSELVKEKNDKVGREGGREGGREEERGVSMY